MYRKRWDLNPRYSFLLHKDLANLRLKPLSHFFNFFILIKISVSLKIKIFVNNNLLIYEKISSIIDNIKLQSICITNNK